MDELRLAIRRLTKRPGAAVVSIVTLACAIGAAAATWSLLSAVLLKPLPVKHADRLVVPGTMQTMGRAAGLVYDGFIYPKLPVFRDGDLFEQVAAEWSSPPNFPVSTVGLPVRASVGFATFERGTLPEMSFPAARSSADAFAAEFDRRLGSRVSRLRDWSAGAERVVADAIRSTFGLTTAEMLSLIHI